MIPTCWRHAVGSEVREANILTFQSPPLLFAHDAPPWHSMNLRWWNVFHSQHFLLFVTPARWSPPKHNISPFLVSQFQPGEIAFLRSWLRPWHWFAVMYYWSFMVFCLVSINLVCKTLRWLVVSLKRTFRYAGDACAHVSLEFYLVVCRVRLLNTVDTISVNPTQCFLSETLEDC